ncbi:phosphoglycolate phosphatase [Parelusimicrobium proximum]|uniref:HAD family hydrolase n=1 Tax=Parelusimicrobium proximum TaxID=3228953 RepID=UPI003D1844B4
MKNFIFDLDGTLVHSAPNILPCFKEALRLNGVKADESLLTDALIGPPLEIMTERVAPGTDTETVQKVIASYRDIYAEDPAKNCSLYAGIRELLDTIISSGKAVFVATYKPVYQAEKVINSFNINVFKDIYGPDRLEGRRINKTEMIESICSAHGLNPAETIMTGDALTDITAAREAGCKSFGAMWGYDSGNKDKIIALADYHAYTAKDLLNTIK